MEIEWWRLGELARGAETVLPCLEVILRVMRLQGHFAELMVALHHLPPCIHRQKTIPLALDFDILLVQLQR